jgi:hypothetical protein
VWCIGTEDPVAVAAIAAIQGGDLPSLNRLLREHPGLAAARLGTDGPGAKSRSLLHVATDWAGHFPNGPATVAALIAAGADVNARIIGTHHAETPLHWAASSDDVPVPAVPNWSRLFFGLSRGIIVGSGWRLDLQFRHQIQVYHAERFVRLINDDSPPTRRLLHEVPMGDGQGSPVCKVDREWAERVCLAHCP